MTNIDTIREALEAVAAALITARDDAIRRELEEWRAIKAAYLIEYAARPNKSHPHQYHGHAHSVDGIWDSDNGALAGCQCIACMVHRAVILGTEPKGDKP